jgi:hypothetical protein
MTSDASILQIQAERLKRSQPRSNWGICGVHVRHSPYRMPPRQEQIMVLSDVEIRQAKWTGIQKSASGQKENFEEMAKLLKGYFAKLNEVIEDQFARVH